MTSKPLTIGRLARTLGVNVETVRYYQRVGLVNEPDRPLTGYRVYSMEVADRIRFIKRAQRLGFSLREIAKLLELGDGHCDDVREQAEKRREQIDAQISDLEAMRSALDRLIEECQTGKHRGHCPIVETLANSTL